MRGEAATCYLGRWGSPAGAGCCSMPGGVEGCRGGQDAGGAWCAALALVLRAQPWQVLASVPLVPNLGLKPRLWHLSGHF